VNYVSYWDSCRFANWLQNGQPTGPQNASTTEDGAITLNGYTGNPGPYGLNAYTGDGGETILRNADARWAVPSEDEWYKAAYYKGGSTNAGYWDYPTSSDMAPGQDMADVLGNNANYYTAPYAAPIDSGKYTTIVGEFQNSDSPYGTFDQGGNVAEWNEAIITDEYSSYRGLRGGSFGDGDALHGANRYCNYPSYESDGIGFRVVEVPEPRSALMVLVGVFWLASIRRRG
jgi:formylglycine-generating enzyme required for sulfatase activity